MTLLTAQTMRATLHAIEEAETACAQYDAACMRHPDTGFDHLAQDADRRASEGREIVRKMVRDAFGVEIEEIHRMAGR